MYSNDKKGFSILDLLVKIIFAALFIFVLIWLFNKKMPNMSSVYSNQFRENIKYMQEAGEAYFTDDKMPVNPGESVRLTLEEMENLNLVLPFVDKDGKACDKKNSYVSITKLENTDGYELKTNLVCGKETNYTVKKLGCHTYCNNGCEKKCSISKITEYEFKQLVKGTGKKYSCEKGYTLKGSTCYKYILKDSKSAIVKTTVTKTDTKDATMVSTGAKLEPVSVVVKTDTKDATPTTTTDTKNATPTTTTDTKNATPNTTTDTKNATPKTDTIDATKKTTSKSYSCQKTRTTTQCTTTYRQEPYSCNCTSTIGATGKTVTVCSTCYKSVPVESCKDVTESYTGTCYKDETNYTCPTGYTLSGTKCNKTTYSCPSGYTLSGTKCNKTTTTYSCPSGYTLSGTKCSKTTTTYTCASGYTLSGKKCSKTTYSCPASADVHEGSGANLKCYKKIAGSISYNCDKYPGYKLDGTKCTKTYTETITKKQCSSGYKLEGDKCNKYETKTAKATAKTVDTSYYKYTWSKEKTLEGWTATGKTRTVDGEEICK